MMSMIQLNQMYEAREPKCERYGQFFVNRFISTSWPELFYTEDREEAQGMIMQWLVDHSYMDCLPPFSKGWESHLKQYEEKDDL